MATIEELREALADLGDEDYRGNLLAERDLLASALDELAALREQIARDAPVLAAVARQMALHDRDCSCQPCQEERQSGLYAAWTDRCAATTPTP